MRRSSLSCALDEKSVSDEASQVKRLRYSAVSDTFYPRRSLIPPPVTGRSGTTFEPGVKGVVEVVKLVEYFSSVSSVSSVSGFSAGITPWKPTNYTAVV
jgi:hypothetical protein